MDSFLLKEWNTDKGFEALYKNLYTPLYRYAMGLLADEMQSEEVVQDVFMRLWQQRLDINIETNIQAYLYRAVHNQIMNLLNHEKVKDKYKTYAKNRTAQYAESPAQTVYAKELKSKIEAALKKIPEKCSVIFHLSRQEELSYKEIAQRLDISIKTVENQMSKALKIMREELQAYLPILTTVLLLSNYFN